MKKSKLEKLVTPSPCPEWLGDSAREVWSRAVPDLVAHGLYASSSDDALANYCLGQGAIIDAAKRGEAPQAALLAQVRQLAITLCIDPAARREWLRQRESEERFLL